MKNSSPRTPIPMTLRQLAAVAALLCLIAPGSAFSRVRRAKATTQADTALTGTITDTVCRMAAHDPSRGAADCARHCVGSGSKFALVVDGRVYTLQGHEEELQKLAGENATIHGAISGYDVAVSSVAAAKSH